MTYRDPMPLWETTLASMDRIDRFRILVVLAITLAIRAAITFWNFDSFSADPDAYRALAQTLSETGVYGLPDPQGQGRATAFRPPLYPYLLSWFSPGGELSRLAVALLHLVLATITVWLTMLTCGRLIDRGRMGPATMAAGLLVAIDPILTQQSTQIMTETLATTIAIAIIWWWARSADLPSSDNQSPNPPARLPATWPIVLGLLLALAYLCRPTFLVWAVWLTFASYFVCRDARLRQRTRLRRIARALVVGTIVAIAVVAWTLRNQHAIGHPVWATSHGGYTLLLANNPSFYDYLQNGSWGDAWDAQPFLNAYAHRYDGDPQTADFWNQDWPSQRNINNAQHDASTDQREPVTEHDDDQRAYLAARATIDRQRGMFLWSCLVRVGRLWSPLPHHTSGRSWTPILVVGLFYTLVYLAAVATLWRLGREAFSRKWWAIWTLALTLSAVHAVYWSNLRMRAPIVPAIAILAAGILPHDRRISGRSS
ncbi:MAG: hypothetical protein HKN47_20740 [Pirellulaceae bacterium]|nr:hypothetical protein [Pirellulaceae bacterium]